MIKFFNTYSRELEVFRPIDPSCIKMYVCGPTIYDRPHIGNARPIVVFDVLFRFLQRMYPKVIYVRNVTDVDDKINNRAASLKITIKELTTEIWKLFQEDITKLGVLHPTIEPKATDHIPQMIQLIEKLIEREYAYEVQNHVIFRVRKDDCYGCLAKRSFEEMTASAGARIGISEYKEDPLDFVLWKPSTDEEPGWDSPWGRGRPGWHIECSAMSAQYLGEEFDIHGGGQDLIFPHHENEIAQSRGAHNGKLPAKLWMHNGMIMFDGRKMAKSCGNVLSLFELLNKFDGEVIRYFLLSAHYSGSLNWNDDTLGQAKSCLDRLYGALRDSDTTNATISNEDSTVVKALSNDLNTPLAFSELMKYASDIFKEQDATKRLNLQRMLKAEAGIMGFLQKDPEQWFKTNVSIDDTVIEELLEKRKEARKSKDFKTADEIRIKLDGMGIIIEDKPNGTTRWRHSS